MMMLQDAPLPPPATPAVQQQVVSRDSAAVLISNGERRLTLRQGPTAEAMIVRYQLVLNRSLQRVATTTSDLQRQLCRWEMTAYLQRDICFTSLSGMTGCTEVANTPLAPSSKGEAEIAPDDEADGVCGLQQATVQTAEAALSAELRSLAPTAIEADYTARVRPGLNRPGLIVNPSR